MIIYCVECQDDIDAKLVTGLDVYPSRPDLAKNKFWRCETCMNSIGCHKDSRNEPLGVIANKELKQARIKIHAIIDPLWRQGKMKRGEIYSHISKRLGYNYHTGHIASLAEARTVWKIVAELHNDLI